MTLKLKSSKSTSTNTKMLRATEVMEKQLGPFTFAMFLNACRTSKDFNQTEMAAFLGISKSTLCDMEKGRQLVSPALAAKIAKKCGMSEALAVQAAFSDQLRKAKLNMQVHVFKGGKAAA